MFFGRSKPSLKAEVAAHPEWKSPIAGILEFFGRTAPGALIDPNVLSAVLRIPAPEVLAYLNVLREAGLGEPVVRVTDPSGIEVRTYPTIRDVPDVETDEFGEKFVVMPEQIHVAFRPKLDQPTARRIAADLVGVGA